MSQLSYDEDLRVIRRLWAGVAMMDFAYAIVSALHRDWMSFLNALVLGAVCVLMRMITTSQQRTRDEARLTRAAIYTAMENQE